MKILHSKSIPAARKNQGGYVVMTLLVMLSVLLVFIMVNMRYLRDLDRELKLVEREQVHRMQKRPAKPTVSVTATNGVSNATILTRTNP